MGNRIEVVVGDITRIPVDAIVNAANSSLLGGGGVDGAIHRTGGDAILAACRQLRRDLYPQGVPTGQAVLTTGGRLPARYVIHTVGPIYQQDLDPAAHLADCYQNCLRIAQQHGLRTIAFSSISTGVYGYPKAAAAQIAVATIQSFMQEFPDTLDRVVLVGFSPQDAAILNTALCPLPLDVSENSNKKI